MNMLILIYELSTIYKGIHSGAYIQAPEYTSEPRNSRHYLLGHTYEEWIFGNGALE
jgi:hypothetical protein